MKIFFVLDTGAEVIVEFTERPALVTGWVYGASAGVDMNHVIAFRLMTEQDEQPVKVEATVTPEYTDVPWTDDPFNANSRVWDQPAIF